MNPSGRSLQGHIPLRFLSTLNADFTLPIQRKPLPMPLLPFSLKKLSLDVNKHGLQHDQAR